LIIFFSSLFKSSFNASNWVETDLVSPCNLLFASLSSAIDFSISFKEDSNLFFWLFKLLASSLLLLSKDESSSISDWNNLLSFSKFAIFLFVSFNFSWRVEIWDFNASLSLSNFWIVLFAFASSCSNWEIWASNFDLICSNPSLSEVSSDNCSFASFNWDEIWDNFFC